MNEKPSINWEWDAVNGILTVTAVGNGDVSIELDKDNFVIDKDKVSCSINSVDGKTHHARAYISRNNFVVSDFTDSTFVVPKVGQSPEDAILEKKEQWVSNQLEAYFKKWFIGDSSLTFPYFISKNEVSEEMKELQNKVIESKNEIGSPLSLFELTNDDNDFQNYDDDTLLIGKGYPELLHAAAWILNDKNEINDSNCETVVAKLKKHSIGVDCSGFVSRALAYLFTSLEEPFEEQKNSLGVQPKEGGKHLRTNVTHIGNNYLVEPENMRSGDILISIKHDKAETGHVKIISEVAREGNEIKSFTTMESSSVSREQIINDVKISNNGVVKQEGNTIEKASKIITIGNKTYKVYRVEILDKYYKCDEIKD